MNKKKFVFIVLGLIVLVLVAGIIIQAVKRSNIVDKEKEKKKETTVTNFVISYSYASNYGTMIDTIPRKITVDQDGNVEITLISEEIKVTPVKYKVDKSAAKEVFDFMIDKNFMKLKEDLSDHNVLDGGSSHMELKYDNKEKKVGGDNPNNKTYRKIVSKFSENIINEQKLEDFEDMVEKEYEKSNY